MHFLHAIPVQYIFVVSAIEQCVDLKTLTLDDLVGRFNAHDERMKITYGNAKVDEHLMLTHAQWLAMVAREKGMVHLAAVETRKIPARQRRRAARGRSQRRISMKRIFAATSAIGLVTSNRSVATLRRRRLSWQGKEMMDL
jgi:hypothetical protein